MAKIRVQDDLYLYVNKKWLDKAIIPDDKPAVGGFINLDTQVEELLIDDFNKMSNNVSPCKDIALQRAVALYKLAKDIDRRNDDGISPILPVLHKIDALDSVDDLNNSLREFVEHGWSLPFACSVDANMKDSLHHAMFLRGPSTILPDVTYYKEGMEEQRDALLNVWSVMATKLLSYTDIPKESQAQYVADALAFDAVIATLVKSSEEWSDYTKIHNPMSIDDVAEALSPIDIKALFSALYNGKLPEQIIVAEPRFVDGFKTLFNENNFQLYKHWAYIMELISATPYLSAELREIGATYSKMLSGVAALPTIEKQSYKLASSIYSEVVGLYYGEKYFGEEAKKDVVEMVKEIVETYKRRISANSILSPATKEKAILKLSTMVIKMGYPDKVDALYNKLIFDESASLYQAISQLSVIRICDNLSKLYENVDREQWVMPGHMVNACYNPTTNDITFPAAILQPPFYSIKQTRSENLGGIGAVIGHEISHAFDNNGAKCDENGNLNDWWTAQDFEKFQEKTKDMIEEFDGIELEWGKVNGAFIVSENIADNGGMAVTLEIMSYMKNANYKQYFYNWARVWCMKARPEYLQLLLSVDVHAPTILRANMQPRNFSEWYSTFNVTENDKMYLPEDKRVVIW